MDVYDTRDISLAAFLQTYNLPLLETLTKCEGGKTVVFFRFNRTPYLRDHISSFYSGEGKVSALEFYRNLRALKGSVGKLIADTRYESNHRQPPNPSTPIC